ncbi:GNAT family N-acetyltransferase [Nonomuraea gerenzanensis]|uniref:GCN5-related N-acetyltransferase n=1 Tax=Nonomuraea gerenzanensis TaxID=93944 RepID=A0A1M4EJE7_9ACTN|nr:GNAT family N-acetyltransferase [Nonomuraea gerenzanensis]UBU10593.1 GNAT family N-acetyltransferase [Nonomuraea gerenzanensis]SBO99005.1 GCN5-related N-acetyltransferase [Nonomuraea gerenzanensis]
MRSSSFDPSAPADADLITERLALRVWTPGDVEAVLDGARPSDGAEALSDGARPAHWAGDFPAEGDQVIAGLLGEHPAWLGPYGHRLIVERDSGLVVGSLGLFWPPQDGAVEIGYGVVASRRGRGYASEATRALTAFALTAPEVHTVLAHAEPANPASIRVLEKAGFRRVSSTEELARFEVTAPYPFQP